MAARQAHILILCKTYPTPSAKYGEVSCVAGIDMEERRLLRLFPVPFRLLTDDRQFKKWQPVRAIIERAKGDPRPESHRIYVDTIKIDGPPISTSDGWRQRLEWLDGLPEFAGPRELERARRELGTTLAIVRPRRIEAFELEDDREDWSEEELAKLKRDQMQYGLFDEDGARHDVRLLEKLPFKAYYRYKCGGEEQSYLERSMVTDWELGALYLKMKREHGEGWRSKVEQKFGVDLPGRNLIFLMGNMRRRPNVWLIVSIIYPPRRIQLSLFDRCGRRQSRSEQRVRR